jgi:hypothetical protein
MGLLLVLALLIGVVQIGTQWAPLRWAEYGLAMTVQALSVLAWWGAKGRPVAVVWSCPYCGGVLGDRLSVRVHIEREHRTALT